MFTKEKPRTFDPASSFQNSDQPLIIKSFILNIDLTYIDRFLVNLPENDLKAKNIYMYYFSTMLCLRLLSRY